MKNLTFRELTDSEVAEVSGGLLRNVLLRNLNSNGDNNVIAFSNVDHLVVNQSGHQSQQHVLNILG
jgi:hypothetical protein